LRLHFSELIAGKQKLPLLLNRRSKENIRHWRQTEVWQLITIVEIVGVAVFWVFHEGGDRLS
jgi:hypothetical protein